MPSPRLLVLPAALALLAGCGRSDDTSTDNAPLAALPPEGTDALPSSDAPIVDDAAPPLANATPAAAATPAGDRVQTLRFPAGETTVAVGGRITGDRAALYKLDLATGQPTTAVVRAASPDVALNIYAPGTAPGDEPIYRGGTRFQDQLSATGTYTFEVYQTRTAARAGKSADYRLALRVLPAADDIAGAAPEPGDPADVVRSYYRAIDGGRYGAAYALWQGQSGKSLAAFRAGFADTRTVRVTIAGRPETEGAAGSIYATVPVTVDAILKDGTPQRFTGDYILRRVNDVDGATPEQLAWHIESANLRGGR